MADPRLPIQTLTGPEASAATAHIDRLLDAATLEGSVMLGLSPVSFVTLGIGQWAVQLADLDAAAGAAFLRALAAMIDPSNTTATGQGIASHERREAAARLFAAFDIALATPEGKG